MAIDTKSKRFSMVGLILPFIKHPIPKGSIDASQRSTLVDLYNGIALSAPIIPSPPVGAYILYTQVFRAGNIKSKVKRASLKTDVQ